MTVEVDTTPSPLDRTFKVGPEAFLGFGVLRPFQRGTNKDFLTGGGEAIVRASVGQILGTRCSSDLAQGEIPWNTEFGSLLHLLRHQNNNNALVALGRVYVTDALKRWEPRVVVKSVGVTRNGLSLNIRLRYDIIAANVPGNQVLVPDVLQNVTV